MSDDIVPGDLCMVVRDCCGAYVGAVVVVRNVLASGMFYCSHCQWHPATPYLRWAYFGRENDIIEFAPITWLKKIPPLSELQGADGDITIKEPEEVL